MEVKYYKNLRQNYLIIKNTESSVNQYQCRMITENEIYGLLPCQERHINGEMLLYYEITSKQSIASLYECGGIGMKQLTNLFVNLKMTWNKMTEFLLEEKCLLLKPEYIFYDLESGEISFLYYPFEPEENYMQRLLEFLTEKVQSDDDRAVDICYKMLDLVEKEQFVMDEVLQWFEQDADCEAVNEEPQEEKEDFEDESLRYNRHDDFIQEIKDPPIAWFATETGYKVLKAVFVLALGIAGACGYISRMYEMTKGREACLFAGFAISGLLLLLSAGLWIYVCLLRKKEMRMNRAKRRYQEIRNNWEESHDLYQAVTKERYGDKAPFCGETVFIPWTENCEYKLYGVGKGNKNHIDLSQLPVVVGKLAGSVDMVIGDASISRRHVKFSRQNGKVCMTDLNSTNGTFKNGVRMEPNTSELLEPGDEIRLGKLKFIYR
ncbi:MAG: FHA domain-containing protein [Lachnospiraceae bacterium]|nr:FHA domain-containing protein [Lachnospiraceae bacterium]